MFEQNCIDKLPSSLVLCFFIAIAYVRCDETRLSKNSSKKYQEYMPDLFGILHIFFRLLSCFMS